MERMSTGKYKKTDKLGDNIKKLEIHKPHCRRIEKNKNSYRGSLFGNRESWQVPVESGMEKS
jgi:hypothetical protein